jgi:hypothetical protein
MEMSAEQQASANMRPLKRPPAMMDIRFRMLIRTLLMGTTGKPTIFVDDFIDDLYTGTKTALSAPSLFQCRMSLKGLCVSNAR